MEQLIAEIRAGKREGSVITSYSVETGAPGSRNEEKEFWREIKRELQDIGVSSDMLRRNRVFVINRLKEAFLSGIEEVGNNPEISSGGEHSSSAVPDEAEDHSAILSGDCITEAVNPPMVSRPCTMGTPPVLEEANKDPVIASRGTPEPPPSYAEAVNRPVATSGRRTMEPSPHTLEGVENRPETSPRQPSTEAVVHEPEEALSEPQVEEVKTTSSNTSEGEDHRARKPTSISPTEQQALDPILIMKLRALRETITKQLASQDVFTMLREDLVMKMSKTLERSSDYNEDAFCSIHAPQNRRDVTSSLKTLLEDPELKPECSGKSGYINCTDRSLPLVHIVNSIEFLLQDLHRLTALTEEEKADFSSNETAESGFPIRKRNRRLLKLFAAFLTLLGNYPQFRSLPTSASEDDRRVYILRDHVLRGSVMMNVILPNSGLEILQGLYGPDIYGDNIYHYAFGGNRGYQYRSWSEVAIRSLLSAKNIESGLINQPNKQGLRPLHCALLSDTCPEIVVDIDRDCTPARHLDNNLWKSILSYPGLEYDCYYHFKGLPLSTENWVNTLVDIMKQPGILFTLYDLRAAAEKHGVQLGNVPKEAY